MLQVKNARSQQSASAIKVTVMNPDMRIITVLNQRPYRAVQWHWSSECTGGRRAHVLPPWRADRRAESSTSAGTGESDGGGAGGRHRGA